MTNELKLNVNYIILGAKLKALKDSLTDSQLEIYNNSILSRLEEVKPTLEELIQDRELLDEVLINFLK